MDQPLCYAARGGIVDVYSMNYEHPVRIEFFDNIVESIRFFDEGSQRTIREVESVDIIPASDLLFTDEQLDELETALKAAFEQQAHRLDELARTQLSQLLEDDLSALRSHLSDQRLYPYLAWLKEQHSISDYCPDARIVLSSREEVHDSIKRIQEETIHYVQEMTEEGRMLAKFTLFRDENACIAHHPLTTFDLFLNCLLYTSMKRSSRRRSSFTRRMKQALTTSMKRTCTSSSMHRGGS